MSLPEPGSPSLKLGLNMLSNPTTPESMMPRQMQLGLRGMPRSLMRALFVGGPMGVGLGIEVRGTEESMKPTFDKAETQRVPPHKTSKGGAEEEARARKEDNMCQS